MSNPAYMLADLLSSWRQNAGGTIFDRVQDVTQGDVIGGHIRAFGYLREIRETLLDMLQQGDRQASTYLPSLDAWWNALILPSSDWHAASNNERGIDDADLRWLNALGGYIEASNLTITDDPIDIGFLTSLISDAEDALNEVGDLLADDMRLYVGRLLREALTVLSEQRDLHRQDGPLHSRRTGRIADCRRRTGS